MEMLGKAARLFADAERKRLKRPLLTHTERIELDVALRAVEAPRTRHRWGRSRRGEVAVGLLWPNPDTFHEASVATLADVLTAVAARGLDPVAVMQDAWSEYSIATDEPDEGVHLEVVPAKPVSATGSIPVIVTDSMGFPLFIPEEPAPAIAPQTHYSDLKED